MYSDSDEDSDSSLFSESESYSDLYNEIQGRFKCKQCEFIKVNRTLMHYHMIIDHQEII